MADNRLPVVLIFGGNDPTGGAGLAADIQTLMSMGCYAAPVVTAVTVQDTVGVREFSAVDADLVIAQARAVLEDMPVAAFKIGMLGTIANLAAVASIIQDYPEIPLVVDPVLTSGQGDPLIEGRRRGAAACCCHKPRCSPNSLEARRLARRRFARRLRAGIIQRLHVCAVTGTHENNPRDQSSVRQPSLLETYTWERLPENYHGSGCTLAAACAATLAHGFDPVSAVAEAQDFTWHALQNALRLGMGQLLPDRLYWARNADDDEPQE